MHPVDPPDWVMHPVETAAKVHLCHLLLRSFQTFSFSLHALLTHCLSVSSAEKNSHTLILLKHLPPANGWDSQEKQVSQLFLN